MKIAAVALEKRGHHYLFFLFSSPPRPAFLTNGSVAAAVQEMCLVARCS